MMLWSEGRAHDMCIAMKEALGLGDAMLGTSPILLLSGSPAPRLSCPPVARPPSPSSSSSCCQNSAGGMDRPSAVALREGGFIACLIAVPVSTPTYTTCT